MEAKRVKLMPGGDRSEVDTRRRGLKHLQQRAVDLVKQLQLFQSLIVTRDMSSAQVLEHFGILQSKIKAFTRQVNQATTPQLDNLSVVPYSVPGPDPATRKFPSFLPEQVPNLLRTKLPPKMEAEAADLSAKGAEVKRKVAEDSEMYDDDEEQVMPWEDIDDALKSLVKSVQGKREEWGMKTGMKASGKRSGTQGHRYWFPNTNVEDNSAALAAMIKAMAPAK